MSAFMPSHKRGVASEHSSCSKRWKWIWLGSKPKRKQWDGWDGMAWDGMARVGNMKGRNVLVVVPNRDIHTSSSQFLVERAQLFPATNFLCTDRRGVKSKLETPGGASEPGKRQKAWGEREGPD